MKLAMYAFQAPLSEDKASANPINASVQETLAQKESTEDRPRSLVSLFAMESRSFSTMVASKQSRVADCLVRWLTARKLLLHYELFICIAGFELLE